MNDRSSSTRKHLFLGLVVALVPATAPLAEKTASVPVTATRAEKTAADREVIEAIENRLCEAEKALDVDGIMSLYIPDESLHVFDMMLPRQYLGAKAFRKDWEDFLAKNAKSIDVCELSELVIEVSGDLAASHYIQHAEFTDKADKKGAANTRLTHVFRRINGKWLIVHEHGSYPIDWNTGKGDLLSKP